MKNRKGFILLILLGVVISLTMYFIPVSRIILLPALWVLVKTIPSDQKRTREVR